MHADAQQDETDLIGEAEYQTLEQTLMESDRGRRFLKEFVKRHKTPESREILDAIQRLEKVVTRQRKVPDLDKIRLDIAEMHDAIERTKLEIANIKAEDQASNRFVDASHELDAIVTQTEGATQVILEAAEKIQEQAWTLREAGADDATCNDIDEKATEIFMACSFQDLTGQRTNKVVQVLRYLESRINLMINIWGIDDLEADDTAGPVDSRPDAHLLNGPQHEGAGVSQSNVDELMSASADIFSAALAETGTENPAPYVADAAVDDTDVAPGAIGEPMDPADIDSMFANNTGGSVETSGDSDYGNDSTETTEFEAAHAPDEVLDEAAIDELFDNDTKTSEAAADDAWQAAEELASADAGDPLEELSEAERQALFN
ncbi:MAG: protein phosphatase CheZ [Roseibium sp.]|nr:protein phosphatase CheZ [Roseibium sp.]